MAHQAPENTQQQLEFQRKAAVDLFNFVWTLLEKPERNVAENDEMVHAAHASRFHWGQVGAPVNLVRGEWQISRVYAVLGRPESGLYHAKRCLELCQEHHIGDFDLAFAYEAMARAFAVAGQVLDCQAYLRLAQAAGQQIEDQEDRTYFFDDLKSIPIKDNDASN